MLYWMV